MSQGDNNTQKNQDNRKALGRGLAALLGDAKQPQQANDSKKESSHETNISQNILSASVPVNKSQQATEKPLEGTKDGAYFAEIALSMISPNPDQPRKTFNSAKIEELSLSLKEHGLVQPIVVRKITDTNFQIIAGERRWRAAKLANLQKIPVIVREKKFGQIEQDLAALVENIQREDLSPIELAISYERMIRMHGYTQEKLSDKLGVSRVSVANTMRLLKLPDSVKEMVNRKSLSEGHSRALLSLATEEEIVTMANEIIEKGLTVRDVENRVKMKAVSMARMPEMVGSHTGSLQKLNEFSALEDELRQLLGTKVTIRGNQSKGTVEVYFSGRDSLNRIIHQLRGTSK
jgi:ParB family chromosome partitioning protein